ncbi:Disease resistance protein RPM1 [Hordeum vulgare]|nr:Disease resistance protein RPM1 [Hordeum vulgare]
MAEIVILLAIKKIGTALANGIAREASTQFAKYGRQLLELQASMDRLVRELSVMHDVLCQMDMRNLNNAVYESWLEGVRKVAYNMEDMVDEYLCLVGQENDIGCCFYLKKGFRKPRSLLSLNTIAIKVKQIEKDLTHLSETKNRWIPMNIGDTSSSVYIVKRSQDLANISHSLDEDLLGVDENRETLQQWLASDHLGRYVIALLGMGGLGKTALAANVYKKERENFQCHAWVSISQTDSREDILRNIIKELSGDKVGVLSNTKDMDTTCLEETIKTFLEQQKYLIILDDVWTLEAFNDFSRVLIHNDKGSRVVGTTRESCVAALASQGQILTLPALPEDKAWDLFFDLCQKNCFGVAYEEKCGGAHQKDERRLVLHKFKGDIQQSCSNMHQLLTMITLGDSKSTFTQLTLLCNESRYMTVLELSGLPIKKIPDAIEDLFNLRHLGLRDSKVKKLPKSVEKLSNLLTLDLFRSDIHELPSGIMKLKMLRHLFAGRVIHSGGRVLKTCSGMCIPNSLGNLTNLHTLLALEAQNDSLRHLGELRQMGSLRLWNVKGIYCGLISKSLVDMRYLSCLDVGASDENEVLLLNVRLPSLQKLGLRGRLAEGALDESSLFQVVGGQNLYELYLFWSQLREDPLPSLSRLSNLTRLVFARAYNGEQLAFLTGWFSKLKILALTDLPKIQEGAMASLERLFLTNLSSMMEVPPGIKFLMSIKYLGFHEISRDFLTSLRHCSAIAPLTSLLYLMKPPSSSSYIQLPLQGNVHPVGYFYVTMEIGGKPYFLDIDTGSSLTWLECMHPNHQCKICKGPHLPYRPNGSLKKVNCADQFCVLISTKTYLIIRIVRVMLGSQTNATIMYGQLPEGRNMVHQLSQGADASAIQSGFPLMFRNVQPRVFTINLVLPPLQCFTPATTAAYCCYLAIVLEVIPATQDRLVSIDLSSEVQTLPLETDSTTRLCKDLSHPFPDGAADSGRIILAQISASSAIPLVGVLLLALPNDPATFAHHRAADLAAVCCQIRLQLEGAWILSMVNAGLHDSRTGRVAASLSASSGSRDCSCICLWHGQQLLLLHGAVPLACAPPGWLLLSSCMLVRCCFLHVLFAILLRGAVVRLAAAFLHGRMCAVLHLVLPWPFTIAWPALLCFGI